VFVVITPTGREAIEAAESVGSGRGRPAGRLRPVPGGHAHMARASVTAVAAETSARMMGAMEFPRVAGSA
jgi:hypothetical protein